MDNHTASAQSFDDGKILIESFNPETETIKMRGGVTLSLKSTQHRVMPVPSAQPVQNKTKKVTPPKPPIRLPKSGLPSVKIPSRNPSGLPRP